MEPRSTSEIVMIITIIPNLNIPKKAIISEYRSQSDYSIRDRTLVDLCLKSIETRYMFSIS